MSMKTYKVFQRKLIETKLEVALCPNCDEEMIYVEDLYFDPEDTILAGYQHICFNCGTASLLPLKYPRKLEIFEENGEVVEYVNYDGSDIYEGGIPICTKIQ